MSPNGFAIASEELERAVRHTLADAGIVRGEISLTVLADDDIRAINRDYLGHDRPTDVISFSLGEPDTPLGDVYLGGDEAARSARALGIELAEEFVRLAVHGTLHVLGHDHPEGEDRLESPMFELQERLVGEIRSRS